MSNSTFHKQNAVGKLIIEIYMGLKVIRFIFKHELKNALLPVITALGVEFGMLLGGAILIETVFSMSGISTLMITSIRMKDTPQVTASIIFFAVLVCITMLIVDMIYAFIDPRIRSKYIK